MRCLSRLKPGWTRPIDPQFSFVSQFYDVLMEHVKYSKWIDHILKRAETHGIKLQWVVDVACGTGNPTLLLAEKGIPVTGLDRSLAMVLLAQQKSKAKGLKVQWAVQDMRTLSLTRKPDAILCLYDSLNFLLTEEDVRQAFASVKRTLAVGGLYFFDVVTERNILLHFDRHVYKEEKKDFSYKWTNQYDPKTGICSSHLTGMCVVDGEKHPFHEFHQERIYPVPVLKQWLEEEGLQVRSVKDAFTDKDPSIETNRVHFECTQA